MMVSSLLAVGIVIRLAEILFALVSLILILVVLIQKGRGGGLSGAFGGGMASGLLGSKTGDFLTWATIVVVSVFLLLAVLLAKFDRPKIGQYGTTPPATTQQTTEQSAAPSSEQQSSTTPPADTGAATEPGPAADTNATGS